jgi:hypothetical protein
LVEIDALEPTLAPTESQSAALPCASWQRARRLTVPTSLRRTYVIECREALESGAWTPVSTVLDDGSICILADTNPADPQRFYRVRVE